jgi:hypothetical protein
MRLCARTPGVEPGYLRSSIGRTARATTIVVVRDNLKFGNFTVALCGPGSAGSRPADPHHPDLPAGDPRPPPSRDDSPLHEHPEEIEASFEEDRSWEAEHQRTKAEDLNRKPGR